MSSRPSKPHQTGTAQDFNVSSRRVVEHAIGDKLAGLPLDDPNARKNPAAVALGKLGRAKGGAPGAKAPTPAQRKAIALKAAHARWKR